MLSQQDLNMIEAMMVRVVGAAIAANNAELKEYVRESIEEAKAELKEYMVEHAKEVAHDSESFLLDEIDRFYNFAKKDTQKLASKVEEIAEYYRIRKMEESKYDYVIRLYHKQQQEINEIRRVLAV